MSLDQIWNPGQILSCLDLNFVQIGSKLTKLEKFLIFLVKIFDFGELRHLWFKLLWKSYKSKQISQVIEIALHFYRSKNFQFESFDEQVFKIFLNIESSIFGQIVKTNLICKIIEFTNYWRKYICNLQIWQI
jgi:hypothetical protein